MKIVIKKIHCPKCERLVRVREQTHDGAIRLSCVRCEQPICVWDGIKWRQIRQ
jgi:hypothetical protein